MCKGYLKACAAGKIQEDHILAKWLSDQLPAQIRVEGTFDNKTSKLEINSAEEQAKDIDHSLLKTVEIFSRFDQQQSESKTRIYKGKEQKNQSEPYKQLCLVVLSSPFFLNEPHHYTRLPQKRTIKATAQVSFLCGNAFYPDCKTCD